MSENPVEAPDVHDLPGGLKAGVEAVLMVVDEPVTAARLAGVLRADPADVAGALCEIRDSLQDRGFELREVGGGWRFFSRRDFAPFVSRFVIDGQTARLTQAALETLAVVAYRQPVARGRIAAIRGVNVDSVMRTLATRGLIEEADTDPETGAVLYQTTSYFLERLGLGSISELPQLSPHLPGIDELDAMDGNP
ncbi:SMC-Scp complex subunit ScpB [Zhihengliuella salsuginis]|uniref:Segregation and condensation protein B n=1 Tax=Zhihengliuella salsuginis TaxID=578222 RepID=A0ABQ3GII3_9MICC|nr:SMC-Scp complex subunit ScpB [Zhihengliuella salsuginis]GHD08908.1 segregation and condensation protein B [Zhihengliuella salsuginis]